MMSLLFNFLFIAGMAWFSFWLIDSLWQVRLLALRSRPSYWSKLNQPPDQPLPPPPPPPPTIEQRLREMRAETRRREEVIRLWQAGILTIDETRAKLGLPPLKR